MFKYIQLILTAFMLCGVASCGNEVAFKHPTDEDLMKAREAQGLSETSPKTELSVQSDSLIPSLTPEQNTQRASYIKENVDKGMVQLQDQLKKTNTIFANVDFTELKQLANDFFGTKWDLENLPPDTSPITRKKIQEENRKQQEALSKAAQDAIMQHIKSLGAQSPSETGTQQYRQLNNPQQYTGPEISISEITPPERDIKMLDRLRQQRLQGLQTQMDEAEISLTQSEIDEFLRLHEEFEKANQKTQLAYRWRQEGKNITQETLNEINQNRNSIGYKINDITSPLEEAIRIKREPELRAKQIEDLRRHYESQNKFPSTYDIELIYENQKAIMDLQREQSKIMQEQYKAGQKSPADFQKFTKTYTEKNQELMKQRAEIEARIR